MTTEIKTKKGAILPISEIKGKPYLLVPYRVQWLSDEVEKYEIHTEFILIDEEQTIARAKITIFKEDGSVLRQATATKRETKRDFSDHTEKAETSAIGRCLALLGYGTQFAIADLDEGERLADSPLKPAHVPIEEKKIASLKTVQQKVAPLQSGGEPPPPPCPKCGTKMLVSKFEPFDYYCPKKDPKCNGRLPRTMGGVKTAEDNDNIPEWVK